MFGITLCQREPQVTSAVGGAALLAVERWQVFNDGLGEHLRRGTRILTGLPHRSESDDQRLVLGDSDPVITAGAVHIVLGADRRHPGDFGQLENRNIASLAVDVAQHIVADVYEYRELAGVRFVFPIASGVAEQIFGGAGLVDPIGIELWRGDQQARLDGGQVPWVAYRRGGGIQRPSRPRRRPPR